MRLKYLPLCLLLSIAPACDEQKEAWTNASDFANKFQAAVQTVGRNPGDYKIVDVARMTTFVWDSLYYFKDDSDNNTADVISYVTGCPWSGPDFRDDCIRLVFTRKGQVSAFVDYIDREESREGHSPLLLTVFFDRRVGLICAHDSARLAIVRDCDGHGIASRFALMREIRVDKNRDSIIKNCRKETAVNE